MYKYYDALLNRSGDALAGHYVRLFDAAGNQVDIYADKSLTPIISESGVANAAKSDDDGMVRFFVESGDYDMRLYDATDTFVSAERAVPMVRGITDGDLSVPSMASGIGEISEGNVQAALDVASAGIAARPTTAALASDSGFMLVKSKRPDAHTYARTGLEMSLTGAIDGGPGVSIFHWIDPALDELILAGGSGSGASNCAAMVQSALDNAPLGVTLTAKRGTFRIETPLLVSREVSIAAESQTTFFGVFNDITKDIIKIKLAEASGGEGRRMSMRNVVIEHAFGLNCRHALNLESIPDDDDLPLLQMSVENCRFAIPDALATRALRIGGLTTQKHVFRSVYFKNGVILDQCADGNRFLQCSLDGYRGFLTDIQLGAFKTEIQQCIIVCRDGALWVKNGAQIDFIENQIEHFPGYGDNESEFAAHVTIAPEDWLCAGIRIIGNNFGGHATKVDRAIYATSAKGAGVQGLIVDENVFGICKEEDVNLADAGVRYTRMGHHELRGDGPKRGGSAYDIYPAVVPNTLNVDRLLAVTDNGVGTRGVAAWRDASGLGGADANTMMNGTCLNTFHAWMDRDGHVHFDGSRLIGPSTAWASVQVLQMPDGWRPAPQQGGSLMGLYPISMVDISNGDYVSGAYAQILDDGKVLMSKPVTAGTVWFSLSSVSYQAARAGYDPGS